MTKPHTIRSFIEKLLVDKAFHDELMAARDQAEAEKIYRGAGFVDTFTKAELDAELHQLKQAAGVLIPIEIAVVPEDSHARWVSRLANLGSRVADSQAPA